MNRSTTPRLGAIHEPFILKIILTGYANTAKKKKVFLTQVNMAMMIRKLLVADFSA